MSKDQILDIIQDNKFDSDLAFELGISVAFDEISYDEVEEVVKQYCKDNNIDKNTMKVFLSELYEYSQK